MRYFSLNQSGPTVLKSLGGIVLPKQQTCCLVTATNLILRKCRYMKPFAWCSCSTWSLLCCFFLWLWIRASLNMFTLFMLLQPPLDVPSPKRPPLMMKMKMRTLGMTTASLMTTARMWAMTQTTSLLSQMTAAKRTSKDCRKKQRPFWRGGSEGGLLFCCCCWF